MDEELTRLIALKYNRFRDSYTQEIDDKEDQLAAEWAGRLISGGFYWSIIELHVNKIKTLYQKRIEIEKDLILKKYGCLDVASMEQLKRTVRGIIAQGFMRLAKNGRLAFAQKNYSKLISEEESKLALQAGKDIEIEIGLEKVRLDEERRKRYPPEHVNPLMEVFTLRDKVNLLFRDRFGFELLELEHEGVLPEIAAKCENENDFVRKILVLGNLIDWMDVKTLKSKLSGDLKEAKSIRVLEEFLNQNCGKFSPMIIENLRDLSTLRNRKFPIHKEGEEVIKIFNRLGAKYPPDDWDFVWKKVVTLYIDSIKGLIDLLS